jgi:lactobin A/cerein 7B family class IIb bacteriocin
LQQKFYLQENSNTKLLTCPIFFGTQNLNIMNLENLGVQEMDARELQTVDGGFVPLVIWGVAVSAKAVAGACVAAFAGGVTIGAAAYLTGR